MSWPCGVGAAQGDRCCPEGCGVAVQAAVSGGLPEAVQVAGGGGVGGEGVPQGGRAELVLAGAAAVLVEVVGDLVAGHAGTVRGRDGLQGPHRAAEFVGGPGQRGVAPGWRCPWCAAGRSGSRPRPPGRSAAGSGLAWPSRVASIAAVMTACP